MKLSYSYGGTKEQPLVSGVVPFTYDPAVCDCVQTALLERTEHLLASLKTVFDDALAVFEGDTTPVARLKALDVMVATVLYTTNTILIASPSVHYAIMYERIQQVFKHMDGIKATFGAAVAENVRVILKPAWVNLRAIDSAFSSV